MSVVRGSAADVQALPCQPYTGELPLHVKYTQVALQTSMCKVISASYSSKISAGRSPDMPPDADLAIPGWALEASICIFIPSSHKNSNASLNNLCHCQIQGILRVACITDAVMIKRCGCHYCQQYLACSSLLRILVLHAVMSVCSKSVQELEAMSAAT